MGSNLGFESADLFRLVQMACDVAASHCCSVSEAIDQLGAATVRTTRQTGLSEFIQTAKRYRLKRNLAFDTSLFRDPAWDMLLDLLLAEEEGKSLSVSALCLGSGVAPTTALRHIQRLTDHGFVLRRGDQRDLRRTFVSLSPSRRAELVRFLDDWRRECVAGSSEAKAEDDWCTREMWGAPVPPSPSAGHPVFLS
jgi:DNA-binding MarR family transcriptional regulator